MLQLAMREARKELADRRAWAVAAVMGAMLGVIGPFGSFAMPAGQRLAYWLVVTAGGWAIGTLAVAGLTAVAATLRLGPAWAVACAAAVLAGGPIAAWVWLLGMAWFDSGRWGASGFAELAAYCGLLSLAVTALLLLAEGPAPAATPPAGPGTDSGADPGPPRLVARLPLPRRGRLLHLKVADHYVEVTTDKGTTLLLMRLSDAIAEAAPVAGLQVHRSHWVALRAVRRVLRRGGRPVIEVEGGALVPVSRGFLPAARAAGLLA